jgi:hypothetical protein
MGNFEEMKIYIVEWNLLKIIIINNQWAYYDGCRNSASIGEASYFGNSESSATFVT